MIVASIDIGTNTIILLIAEVNLEKRSITPLCNEQRIPRIGENLVPGKAISGKKMDELFQVLSNFNSSIKKFKCNPVLITATNAFRIASNKREVTELIKKKFNWDVKIVSGEAEAELTFKGAANSFSDNFDSLVIDIGGGSTEIILGNTYSIEFKKSFQAGVVSAKEKFLKYFPPLPAEIEEMRNELAITFSDLNKNNFEFKRAIAIAGTPTTLAAMKLNLIEYNEELLEGSLLYSKEIQNFINKLSLLNVSEILKEYRSVVKGREDVILSGALILDYIMKLLNIDVVIVSTKGIRYGAIYDEFFNL